MDGDDSSWMDRFLAAFFERRPVDATYVGVPGYDHLLPDLSAAAVAATAEEMRSLLREAEAEPAVSGFAEQTDRRLAQGFLRIQLWELSSRWMIGNPSFVVGEAIFGMMSLLQCLHEPETRADRIASLRSRMLAVPNFLRTAAETHLDASSVPSAWVEKARTECGAALSFLSEGVKCLPEDLSVEAAAAAAGFEAYDSALQYVLEQGAQDFVGCGSVAFERYMEEGHCLAMTGDEIVAHAQRELETARAWKDVPSLGGVTPSLNSLHPSTGQYLNRFGEVWDTIKALVDEKQLLTWPDFPIEYEPYPNWSRSSVSRLYFLHYRTPKVYGTPGVHKYMVTPIEPAMGEHECSQLLATNNNYVIKTNHVIHHGGVGHHVQNWHAPRSPCRIGRIGHIDVASRIAFFCAGTMAEGWACYATDLIAEVGGLTDQEVLTHRRSRIRMCARAIVDVELHNQRMTLGDATGAKRMLGERGNSSRRVLSTKQRHGTRSCRRRGTKEFHVSGCCDDVRCVHFPRYANTWRGYLIGTDMIHKLRADLAAEYGEAFCLRDFHDTFLSYGSIPVKLISDDMRRRSFGKLPLAGHALRAAL